MIQIYSFLRIIVFNYKSRVEGGVVFVNETLEKGSFVIRLMERSRACEYSAGVAGGVVGAPAVRLSRASSSGGRSQMLWVGERVRFAIAVSVYAGYQRMTRIRLPN